MSLVYEFISDKKVILVIDSDVLTAQEVIANQFISDFVVLKSVYKDLKHYEALNSSFPKYFKEKTVYLQNNDVTIYELL